MVWEVFDFKDLSASMLYALLKLRAEVFVVEQDCVYNDLDELDKEAVHLLGFLDDKLVAYSRILPANSRFKSVSIGRVVTKGSVRGRQYGKSLMKESIDIALDVFNADKILISAQQYLEKFYTDLGFRKISEPYLEDGIPHIKMELKNIK